MRLVLAYRRQRQLAAKGKTVRLCKRNFLVSKPVIVKDDEIAVIKKWFTSRRSDISCK
jgi:hypothetical protein